MRKLVLFLSVGLLLGGMILYAYFTRAQADSVIVPVVASPTPTRSEQIGTAVSSVHTFGEVREVSFDSGSTHITDYFADDTGKAATIDEIKSDCFFVQKSVWSNPSQINEVSVTIAGPVVDAYGHQSDGTIGQCSLRLDTEARFAWDGLDQDAAWKVYDSTWLLPDLTT